MTFDPNALNALLAMDDRTLWQTVRQIAAAHNLVLPDGAISAGDMQRLRSAMAGRSQADVDEAIRIVSEYGKRRK